MDTHYTFDTPANDYYAGHDLRVRWDDRSLSILVNEKDGCLAFDVKDHDTFNNLPLGAQAAAEKIGDTETQLVYDRVQHEFWDWAGAACKDYGFDTIYQAGRSGGWLAVAGTEHLDGSDLIEPDEAEQDVRDRFLDFAFAVEQALENEGGYKQQFYAALVEAGEQHREHVQCPNCDLFIDPRTPAESHGDHCLVAVVASVLLDRDHEPTFDISKIDVNQLWDRFGGPMVNRCAEEMGIDWFPDAPETETDK